MSSGYCPIDSNTGFIELVGPIQQQDLQSITVDSYPLSVSFSPRKTAPTLIGNRIDESSDNTCTYRGQKFTLVDVQICDITNRGFILPGNTERPVAELILSFSSNTQSSDIKNLSGVLLCFPIYDSGFVLHDAYIKQLIDPDIPSCKYSNTIGAEYVGSDYNNIPNSDITGCIKACCGDPKCLAYTFKNGTCYLKNSVPNISKTSDLSMVSGTVDHTTYVSSNKTCPQTKQKSKKDSDNAVANLQTLFYDYEQDDSQTSFTYKTCFETLDSENNPTSRSLYIVVFPNGIHLSQQDYQQLILQLSGTLQSYTVPPAIRGADVTVRRYKFDDEGNKVPTLTSSDGMIYRTGLSSCTDEFKVRFEYFTKPPRLPTTKFHTDVCPYYQTTQYKCVPFNQLTDLSGNYVIPGNTTLKDVLQQQNQLKEASSTVTLEGTDIVEIVAWPIAICVVSGILYGVSKIFTR